jgi:hypothetical protein
VGYAPIWEMGGVYPYMETPQRRGFLGGLKLITAYYSQVHVHGVMTYITPSPFFAIFFHTLLNIILVSNNHTFTISFSLLIYLPICAIFLSSYFYDLVYYYIGDIKNGHENLNFLNGFVFIILFMFNAW